MDQVPPSLTEFEKIVLLYLAHQSQMLSQGVPHGRFLQQSLEAKIKKVASQGTLALLGFV